MQEVTTSEQTSNSVLFALAVCVAIYTLVEVVRGLLPDQTESPDLPLPLLSPQRNEYGTIGADSDFSYEQLLALSDVIGFVKTGLSEDELGAISNVSVFDTALSVVGATDNACICPICLEAFELRERLMLLGCTCHWFHAACVTQWLLTKPSCPCCRCSFI
jgi:Ring finger domain